MVRAVIAALVVSGCFAEDDVYYHTQLLQTKATTPQKVVVDTNGAMHDDTALFQKSFSKKLHRTAKQAAETKLFATMKSLQHRPGRDGGQGGAGGPPPGGSPPPPTDFGPAPPEAEEQCKIAYGDDTNVNQCWSCVVQTMMADDPSRWHPDPEVGFRAMLASMDTCMGQTNHITATCEESYGEDVRLMDCCMCGMMCECVSPSECDPECHQGCMASDEEAWEEEEHHGADDNGACQECKMFYPEVATKELCEECDGQCWEQANQNAESTEQFFMNFVSCFDGCMGATNIVSQQCQAGYGPEVDLWACFNCGMECGCEPGKECDHACHGGCMQGGAVDLISKTAFFQKHAKAKTDVTDLIQTSKHLK
jgi:hypothetical protein